MQASTIGMILGSSNHEHDYAMNEIFGNNVRGFNFLINEEPAATFVLQDMTRDENNYSVRRVRVELCPNEEAVDESRLLLMDSSSGIDKSFQSHPIV